MKRGLGRLSVGAVLVLTLFSAGLAGSAALDQPRPPGPAWERETAWDSTSVSEREPGFPSVTQDDELVVPPFTQLLYQTEKHHVAEAIEANVALGPQGVVDLLLDAHDFSAYRLRISRAGEPIRSSLSRIDDQKETASLPLDLPPGWNVAARVTVRLEHESGMIFASVNGRRVAELPAPESIGGRAGFSTPLETPFDYTVESATVAVRPPGGGPTIEMPDRFVVPSNWKPAVAKAGRAAARVLLQWLGLGLLVWASVAVPFRAVLCRVALGFIPILAFHLLFLHSHPDLADDVASVLLLGTYLITLARNRERIRWRVPAREPGAHEGVAAAICRAISGSGPIRWGLPILLALAALIPLLQLQADLFPPELETAQPTSLAEGRSLTLEVGQKILPQRLADFEIEGTFQLGSAEEPESNCEIYFRMKKPERWYALRLTTGTADRAGALLTTRGATGCGFVSSLGSEGEGPLLPALVAGRSYQLKLRVVGDKATATLDGTLWDRMTLDGRPLGETGLVQRDGVTTFTALSATPIATGRFWSRPSGRALALALGLVLLPFAAVMIAVGLARLTRLSLVPIARAQWVGIAPFYLLCLLATLLRTGVWNMPMLLFTGLALWLLVNLLFLVGNQELARFYSLLMLAVLTGLVVSVEGTVRHTSLNRTWRLGWQGGYIQDRFLMTPLQQPMIIPSYRNRPLVFGLDTFQSKPDRVTRVLCIGGSTTRGYGTREKTQAYPAHLKTLLEERYPKRGLEVINAGYNAHATLDMLLYLDRDLARLKPDLLIVRAGVNDLFPQLSPLTQRQQWDLLLSKTQPFGLGWVTSSRLLSGALRRVALERLTFGPAFVERNWLGRALSGDRRAADPRMPRATAAEFRQNLEAFIAYGKANNIPVILVDETRATQLFTTPPPEPLWTLSAAARIMAELASRDRGSEPPVFYLATGPLIRAHIGEMILLDDVHGTRRGNEWVARALFPTVISALHLTTPDDS